MCNSVPWLLSRPAVGRPIPTPRVVTGKIAEAAPTVENKEGPQARFESWEPNKVPCFTTAIAPAPSAPARAYELALARRISESSGHEPKMARSLSAIELVIRTREAGYYHCLTIKRDDICVFGRDMWKLSLARRSSTARRAAPSYLLLGANSP